MRTTSLALGLLWTAAASAWAPSASFGRRHHRPSASTSMSASSGDSIEFAKYEGLGNDFILIDDRSRADPSLTPEQSERLCNRNFCIGADGVIFALAPPEGDDAYDFTMRIYNSDGSEPEMCGNGIRCLAQFLKDLGEDTESYRINTLAGPIVPVMNADGTVTVDMGEPILKGADVPTTLEPNAESDSVVEQTLECNGKEWKVSAVSMGNPHAIIFVDDLEADIDFASDGPALEADPAFPAKTNVEFVQVMSPTHLKMKVWERGAGPTLACGTGTCALVVAAIRAGKIPRPEAEGVEGRVRVTLPGGDLFIEWRESNNRVYMSGPATLSFSGKAMIK
uniref:diaminopimelate epimerase n=1 Tax=Trieres chinensis TaxID=1514140 RepID=A0A7S1ZW43_TRICV|eukprot:CAMPEP_0183308886 /NCGR_PEP_ID=MMETSP0160_2-20130417/22851_1 /TAXON_ID=2839 ORGANISM="Odontella Sinensis, Strain Grunow 1884" /NCGR_SAMPLE_ID=MMETSP0160_2 /ASSEMBLY_ACC=CAM_ASM_000250 /LENGTH=336 /DNA_ID=CAMNT_0025472801 /DNA_START=61 /DNA_END=1071 /DNA_ORIENTATION=+